MLKAHKVLTWQATLSLDFIIMMMMMTMMMMFS